MDNSLIELSKINLKPSTLEEALIVIAQMAEIIIKLSKTIEDLKEQLKLNSNNSSKPPSSDLKKPHKVKKEKSNKKQGAQPGHKGTFRKLLPPEQVDQFVNCLPAEFCVCGGKIEIDNAPHRHQVYETPKPRYEVIEYQIFSGRCSCCNEKYKGQLPKGVTFKMFGAKTHALLAILTSRYRLSKRLAKKLLEEMYQLPISVGSVSNVEGTVSKAISETYNEVNTSLKKEAVLHIDETGCKQSNKNGWAWVLGTLNSTLFLLNHSRGRKVAKSLIGDAQNKIIISDRYSSYNYLSDDSRQLCWAHLKRDLQKISERNGSSGKLGYRLLKTYRKIFSIYQSTTYKYRIHHKKTSKRLKYLIRVFEKSLLEGSSSSNTRTQNTCKNIISIKKSLWTFLTKDGIEPTNNQAERQLRPLVIWRKLSFGTQSDRGSRFVERIFTITSTCIQQGKNTLEFLQQAVINYFAGSLPPILLSQ